MLSASHAKTQMVRSCDDGRSWSAPQTINGTALDERVPGVEFKLKNSGNRTLDLGEVTVYFSDHNGRAISEEDYHPVLVSEMSFEPSKPLKPGYIWQMETGKFYQAPHGPTEWQEANAVAKITDLAFAQ
jgi:hypothetical protein